MQISQTGDQAQAQQMQTEALEALRARGVQFVAGVLELVLRVVVQIRLLHPDLVRFQLAEVHQNLTRRALSGVYRTVDVTAPVEAIGRKNRWLAQI